MSSSSLRRCEHCSTTKTTSWRKHPTEITKYVCNKCGIYYSRHKKFKEGKIDDQLEELNRDEGSKRFTIDDRSSSESQDDCRLFYKITNTEQVYRNHGLEEYSENHERDSLAPPESQSHSGNEAYHKSFNNSKKFLNNYPNFQNVRNAIAPSEYMIQGPPGVMSMPTPYIPQFRSSVPSYGQYLVYQSPWQQSTQDPTFPKIYSSEYLNSDPSKYVQIPKVSTSHKTEQFQNSFGAIGQQSPYQNHVHIQSQVNQSRTELENNRDSVHLENLEADKLPMQTNDQKSMSKMPNNPTVTNEDIHMDTHNNETESSQVDYSPSNQRSTEARNVESSSDTTESSSASHKINNPSNGILTRSGLKSIRRAQKRSRDWKQAMNCDTRAIRDSLEFRESDSLDFIANHPLYFTTDNDGKGGKIAKEFDMGPAWSKVEDDVLISEYQKYGKNFNHILSNNICFNPKRKVYHLESRLRFLYQQDYRKYYDVWLEAYHQVTDFNTEQILQSLHISDDQEQIIIKNKDILKRSDNNTNLWTDCESEIIMLAVQHYRDFFKSSQRQSKKMQVWQKISELLPGRNAIEVKTYYEMNLSGNPSFYRTNEVLNDNQSTFFQDEEDDMDDY